MKEILLNDKYPVFTIEIKKEDTSFNNIDEIFTYLNDKVKNHPIATFIAIFDHYKHTKTIEEHIIQNEILDAKNFIFCFGKELSNSKILALRPRSVGVAEYKDYFDISTMQVPNPILHEVLMTWIKDIKNR